MKRNGKTADPIFGLIQAHRSAQKTFNNLCHSLDVAESRASMKHGRRPFTLIAWRNYSAIDSWGINNARREFLEQPDVNRRAVGQEYRAAMGRLKAAERAAVAWDRRSGVADIRKQMELARDALSRAGKVFAKARARTVAGVSALIDYILADELCDDKGYWHAPALKAASVVLKAIAARVVSS